MLYYSLHDISTISGFHKLTRGGYKIELTFGRWFERGGNVLDSTRCCPRVLEFEVAVKAIKVSLALLIALSLFTMDELTDQLFSLMTPDMKAELENSMQHDMGIQSKSLRRMPPDPMAEKGPSLDHNNEYPLAGLEEKLKKLQNVKPRFPPLEKLPCANVQVERYTICENPGTSTCSACKLVSYCSKVSRLTVINAYNAFNTL